MIILYDAHKSNWLNPNIEYIFNTFIYEYDIHDAGLTILKKYNMIDDVKYNELINLEKHAKNVAIGCIQREDKSISDGLKKGFEIARRDFIEKNKLTSNNIISVKKDAIFTIGKCKHLEFDTIHFRNKNEYTSYIRFVSNMNIEVYYGISTDIKGMSDLSVNKHRLYMYDELLKMINYIESKNTYIKRYLKKFIMDYKHGNLEDEYYIEFNNKSSDFNPSYNFINVIIPLVHIVMKEFR